MTPETYFTIVIYILTASIGLCIGSFLNVVIYRSPLNMSLATPPSHCPQCKNRIKWYDNIPVVSYMLLGGKCRFCKCHIPFRYTAVEIGNCIMWLLCLYIFGTENYIYTACSLVTVSVLICVFFIDLEHKIILDRFQIILACLAIVATLTDKGEYGQWYSHIIGCVAGFAVFYLIAFVGSKVLGREALGGGDIKLVAVMGLFLGWQKLLLALLIASVAASLIIIVFKRISKKDDIEYPFAPFLTSGFAISMLFGEKLISCYLSLFKI